MELDSLVVCLAKRFSVSLGMAVMVSSKGIAVAGEGLAVVVAMFGEVIL